MAECPFPLLNKPYPHDDLARAVRKVLDSDDDQAPHWAGSGVNVSLSVSSSTQNLHDLTLLDRREQCLRAGGMPEQHQSKSENTHAV